MSVMQKKLMQLIDIYTKKYYLSKYGFIIGSVKYLRKRNKYKNIFLKDIDKVEATYNMLDDQYSKDMYEYTFLYRVERSIAHKFDVTFNKQHEKTKFNKEDRVRLNNAIKSSNNQIHDIGSEKIEEFDTEINGFYFKGCLPRRFLYGIFYVNQYKYSHNGNFCGIEEGDYIIDGGGFIGDTALAFANQTGKDGKVFSFEFFDDNKETFKKIISFNPYYKDNIQLCEYALWSKNIPIYISGAGSSTTVSTNKPKGAHATTSQAITIDSFMKEHNINKMNFIKMDIEGAEIEALKGAKQTIQAYKPKLAICLYHKDEHFWQIPFLIKEYLPDSKFYFDHFHTNEWESVLFVMPK